MNLGIRHRLFLAMLAATAAVALGMFLIMQWSINRGFLRYVNTLDETRLDNLAEDLEAAFATRGDWHFLRDDPRVWWRLVYGSMPGDLMGPEQRQRMERRLNERLERNAGQGEKSPPPPPMTFEARVILLDQDHTMVKGHGDPAKAGNFRTLKAGGRTVGFLGLLPRQGLTDIHQLRFVEQQNLALGLITGVMVLVSALIGLPLARRLARPIRALAEATHRLTSGAYATRVAVTSRDEIGRLAEDFNALALTLERNEQARRQWVADISHELRTPLAVLRGEIEALQDGVRQATTETLGSLHGEVMRLSRLVDDLFQLSLSDLGGLSTRKEPLDLAEVLEETLEPYLAKFVDKAIALNVDGIRPGIFLEADPTRLGQLFTNLLENSLRYTDSGGRLDIALTADASTATVRFSDSAPGVDQDQLPRLFERLYRAEGSRSRATGGAGLGLAICRNIVEAHGGTIAAEPSPLGGVSIVVRLHLTT